MTAIGGKLGRYDVIKHLAQGGMAEVLLGRSSGIEGFERYVVIKRIRWDQARDEQFVKMFLDEARLAASLHHNNILQVHDIGEESGEYFFTMEYLHGQDLRKLLKRVVALEETVPLEHVLTIVINAAAGLHFAHDHRGADRLPLGIVHRDVSLSNIMVGYDGFVKVTDFGIAKAAMRSAETRSGVLKGKVAYMSPEQCLGRAVDRRSDVYALGIVLYELATARRLYKGDSDFLIMSAIVDGNIPPPSSLRRDIDPALEAIILKALARRPANRYQTADELRSALEDYALQTRMRTSGTALAAYMKQLFGEQPQPWLSDAPLDQPDDSDFDGSASGIVGPLTDAMRELALPSDTPDPSAPIMRARTKATTRPPSELLGSDLESRVAVAPVKRNLWKYIVPIALIGSAAAVAIVLATRGPAAEPAETKSVVQQPEPPKPEPVKPEPAKLEPTKATASDVAPAVTDEGAGSNAAGSSAPGAGSSVATGDKGVKRPKPRQPPKPPPKQNPKQNPKWDPDELLPK